MAMTLSSSVFRDNGSMPERYTCSGEDVAPPLSISGVPATAKSLVLIVDDPDAPDPRAPRMTWVHWLVYNLPPKLEALAEGADRHLPAGALHGSNDWKRADYGGPCPPIGEHRYFFKLYALDTLLPDLHHPSKARLEQAMQGHIVEACQIIGLYAKS